MSHDRQEVDLRLMAGVTDRGLRHKQNEDAMELAVVPTADGTVLVAVVCDGVSTSIRPQDASLAAAQAAARVLRGAAEAGTDLSEALAEAVRPPWRRCPAWPTRPARWGRPRSSPPRPPGCGHPVLGR